MGWGEGDGEDGGEAWVEGSIVAWMGPRVEVVGRKVESPNNAVLVHLRGWKATLSYRHSAQFAAFFAAKVDRGGNGSIYISDLVTKCYYVGIY